MKRSLDLRERALVALGQGMKRSQVCLVFGIHRTTLRCWQKREAFGVLADVAPAGGKRLLTVPDEEHLVAQLQAHPDATVDEHLRLWQQSKRVPVSRATLGRALLHAGWTRKKRA
jgi:transposase